MKRNGYVLCVRLYCNRNISVIACILRKTEIHSAEQNVLGMRATGRTLSEEPMTIKRSTSSLSCFMALWNISGRFSPKKTMSGFMIARGISGHRGHRGTTCRTNSF